MKSRTEPRSGKHENMVAKSNAFGPYDSKHSPPRTPPSALQKQMRAEFGDVSKAWEDLTDEQRQIWNTRHREAKSKSRLGQRWALTGQTWFMSINKSRKAFGLPFLKTPPARAHFRRNPVIRLIITNDRGRIALKLQLAEPPTAPIMVFGARPCNRGVSKCFKCPRLGPLPSPHGGFSNITRLYARKHGMPQVGERVFIRTRQQIDGWQDMFVEMSAVVLGPSSGAGRTGGTKVLR
jgi:hypothetical protein